jgi:3-hydroxybutyryl-CoA dehydrogenase
LTFFENVAVLGFGTMGGGIAQVVAQSGRTVTVLEADQDRIDAGRKAVDAFLSKGVERGKVSEAERKEALERITGTTDIKNLARVDLVIEAVTERKDVKSRILEDVAGVVTDEALITTNTSAISVSELAMSVRNPERFAGLHFFNPTPLMSIVEVVRGLGSAPETIHRLQEFVKAIGKEPVVTKDRPGFLVNKLFMPYINDVIRAYDEELASAEDIDTAIRLGLGYKMGPLELVDLIGLDVHEHATRAAYDATFDPIYAPPPLLQTMVASGSLGNKNGRGFRIEKAN